MKLFSKVEGMKSFSKVKKGVFDFRGLVKDNYVKLKRCVGSVI